MNSEPALNKKPLSKKTLNKKGIFVTGTDTGIGKTVVSAGLCVSLSAHYWKPIQAGFPTDMEFIGRYISKDRIYPSAYILKRPLSPNQAAEAEGFRIESKKIVLPQCSQPLVIEGAGGALVPYNDREDMVDLMKKLACPVLIVARSTLGTLNHSLLTISALRSRGVNILGLVLVGPFHALNKRDIEERGKVRVLLELPILESLEPTVLKPFFKNLFS